MILPLLTALAEPARLAAMALLWDGEEHCVCELMARLEASQSRMSRHMGVLKRAGLVVNRLYLFDLERIHAPNPVHSVNPIGCDPL